MSDRRLSRAQGNSCAGKTRNLSVTPPAGNVDETPGVIDSRHLPFPFSSREVPSERSG